jgi:hypothetical protein
VIPEIFNKLKNPKVRRYIYNIVRAAIPLLLLAGVLIPGTEEVFLIFVASLLGLGGIQLASHNTPNESDTDFDENVSDSRDVDSEDEILEEHETYTPRH